MSIIIFPGLNHDALDDPEQQWMYTLCSKCGRLERGHPGDDKSSDDCGCIPDDARFAVILLLVDNREEVWQRLTQAGIADHVMARVWRLMCGREEAGA